MHRWLILTIAAIPVMFTAMRPAPPAMVWWTAGSLVKVRPYDSPPNKLKDSVEIAAARNEFESFQVVFRAESQDVDGIDLDVSDFDGPGEAVLPKSNVTIYFERYLDLPQPSSMEGKAGAWPDALIPKTDRYFGEKRNAFPFKLLSRHDQPIWIEVYVPPSIPPGTYHGNVTISVNGKRDATVPVSLEVWKFALPSTSSFTTTFGLNGLTALRQHLGKYTSDEDVIRFTGMYRKAALWHRLSVHNGSMVPPKIEFAGDKIVVDWTTFDNEIGPFLDGNAIAPNEPLYGARVTSVDFGGTSRMLPNDRQRTLYLQAIAAHFREKGWFDRAFNYLWDEPKPQHYSEVLRLGKLAHDADPGIRNLVTASYHADWAGVVDIFVPILNCFAFKPGLQNACDQPMEQPRMPNLWWYQSCASHGCDVVGDEYYTGWPTYMIDVDSVSNRVMPWMAWKYDIKGELYYGLNEAHSHKGDAWTNIAIHGGNGEGTLLYPGRPRTIGGKTDIPIESIRLKIIRDGLEDYEYFVQLAKSGGDKAVSEVIDQVVTNAYKFDRDASKMEALRRQIGERLNK